MKFVTSRVGLLVTSKLIRLGNAVSPSTLLSWLLAALKTLSFGKAFSLLTSDSLFFDRLSSARFGNCWSSSFGMQVKPRPDKLKLEIEQS